MFIGRAGLAELRKVDPEIAATEEDLFDGASLNMQRALLTKEENIVLNKKLERVIMQLSAYLHHRSAKQILEWLIFQFHVIFMLSFRFSCTYFHKFLTSALFP